MSLLILGSVALDTIETERGKATECLGGSATHAALAASYFVKPRLVGVVGDDFPAEYRQFLAERIDLSELAVYSGKTFRWDGYHSLETGRTITRATHLNTYEHFRPRLSPTGAAAPYIFLGNIDPELQLSVLDQLASPRCVACDTMSLWISLNPEKVLAVMRRADLFFLNEQEAFELTHKERVIEAGQRLLDWGAQRVIIKCGGQGVWIFDRKAAASEGPRHVPAVPDVDLVDPTGAGDSFAGALMGYLARLGTTPDETDALLQAAYTGAAVASHTIEAFGADAHRTLSHERIFERVRLLAGSEPERRQIV